jgi:feruloyl-CoA synthase
MAYGTTETHGVLSVTQDSQRAFLLGLPKPGVLAKLALVEPGYELRIKAASVTPGYFADETATAEAFDDEGFFRTGDGVLIDPDGLGAGLVFAGRSGDTFKIASGTWVSAAALRAAVMDALQGEATDCLIVGEGQLRVGAVLWCDESPGRREQVIALLKQYNASATGESRRIARIVFSAMPISSERFERTEKGSLNRALILANRSAEIADLYKGGVADVVDLTEGEDR